MGGGQRKFLYNSADGLLKGDRKDSRNLIQEWKDKMAQSNLKAKYVSNLSEFNDLKPNQYDHVLGI